MVTQRIFNIYYFISRSGYICWSVNDCLHFSNLKGENGLCDSRGLYVCIYELLNLTGSYNSYR